MEISPENVQEEKRSKTRNRVLIVVVFSFLTIFVCCSLNFAAFLVRVVAINQPGPYVEQLSIGMNYNKVMERIPEKFISSDLHPVVEEKYSYPIKVARKKGYEPAYIMVLSDTLWPLTTATACYLFFNEEKCLIYHFTSSS